MHLSLAEHHNLTPETASRKKLSARKRASEKWCLGEQAANEEQILCSGCTQDRPIHMNGRVFDPVIGRFLSADPHIQASGNLQSFNRYSYVINNPLKYTDPSGYIFKKLKRAASSFWRKNRRGFFKYSFGIGGNSSTYRNIVNGAGCIALPGACGAITGANAYASGASTKQALSATVKAQVGAWVGQGISNFAGGTMSGWNVPGAQHIGNGIGGGVQMEINGGQFKDGFVGGFAGSLGAGLSIPGVDPRIMAGFVGGTSSYLSGGKFGYGAFTGAFAAQWNHCMHGNICNGSGKEVSYVGADGKTYTVRVRQSAEGMMAENTGAKSIDDYNTTTQQEVDNAAAMGAALSAPYFVISAPLATFAAFLDPSFGNLLGASLGPLGKAAGFVDDGLFYGDKVFEGVINNAEYMNNIYGTGKLIMSRPSHEQ